MNLGEERRRLSAAWLNTVAAGLVSSGDVAPAVSQIAHEQYQWQHLVLGGVLVSGVILHLSARALLGWGQVTQASRSADQHTQADSENKT